jgi:hypothetical protein
MTGEPTPTVLPSPGDNVTLRCFVASAAAKVRMADFVWSLAST